MQLHRLALLVLLCLAGSVQAQTLLQSGPMVGYSEMQEVMLWVQTTEPAKVQILYTLVDGDSQGWRTNAVTTRKEEAFTAHLLADEVMPGRRYNYTLYINDQPMTLPYRCEFQTQALWKWRSDPPAVKFATGSCLFVNEAQYDRPGNPYGRAYEIIGAIQQQKPDFMLWLGDNIYLREADWNSRTGILHRYTHSRSMPELQPLLASTHNYAIWDDHDFGPNDSDRGFYLKEASLEAFNLFWANPGKGLQGTPGAISHFQWADLEFFLLDNRMHRTPDGRVSPDDTQLGKAQLEWLLDGLQSSLATFKFVCIGGQFLNTATVYETYANVAPEERQYILDRIAAAKIKGVVFLTGDRHHTELSKWESGSGTTIWELTASPITSGPNPSGAAEANTLRVDGTFVGENNFATLEVTGKEKERVLGIKVLNATGKELWAREIRP